MMWNIRKIPRRTEYIIPLSGLTSFSTKKDDNPSLIGIGCRIPFPTPSTNGCKPVLYSLYTYLILESMPRLIKQFFGKTVGTSEP